MNTSTRTLVIAAPLAALALSVGASTAQAAGPGLGPGDLTNPVRPTHPKPYDGPKDWIAPKPGGGGGNNGGNGSGTNGGGSSNGREVRLPTRIDAGTAPISDDAPLTLVWVLAGGAIVSAAGAAVARGRA